MTRDVAPSIIIEATIRFRAYCEDNQVEERFIPYPERWLNRGSWDDELPQLKPMGAWAEPAVGTPEYEAMQEAEWERAMREND